MRSRGFWIQNDLTAITLSLTIQFPQTKNTQIIRKLSEKYDFHATYHGQRCVLYKPETEYPELLETLRQHFEVVTIGSLYTKDDTPKKQQEYMIHHPLPEHLQMKAIQLLLDTDLSTEDREVLLHRQEELQKICPENLYGEYEAPLKNLTLL